MRYSSGTIASDYRYTGQLEQAQIGLDYYIAKWYDPTTGHFIQADTVVSDPAKTKNWDKYAYVNNSPTKSIDPSGHDENCSSFDYSCQHQVEVEKQKELDRQTSYQAQQPTTIGPLIPKEKNSVQKNGKIYLSSMDTFEVDDWSKNQPALAPGGVSLFLAFVDIGIVLWDMFGQKPHLPDEPFITVDLYGKHVIIGKIPEKSSYQAVLLKRILIHNNYQFNVTIDVDIYADGTQSTYSAELLPQTGLLFDPRQTQCRDTYKSKGNSKKTRWLFRVWNT